MVPLWQWSQHESHPFLSDLPPSPFGTFFSLFLLLEMAESKTQTFKRGSINQFLYSMNTQCFLDIYIENPGQTSITTSVQLAEAGWGTVPEPLGRVCWWQLKPRLVAQAGHGSSEGTGQGVDGAHVPRASRARALPMVLLL